MPRLLIILPGTANNIIHFTVWTTVEGCRITDPPSPLALVLSAIEASPKHFTSDSRYSLRTILRVPRIAPKIEKEKESQQLERLTLILK